MTFWNDKLRYVFYCFFYWGKSYFFFVIKRERNGKKIIEVEKVKRETLFHRLLLVERVNITQLTD